MNFFDPTRGLPDIEATLAAVAGDRDPSDSLDKTDELFDARIRQVRSLLDRSMARYVDVQRRLHDILRPDMGPAGGHRPGQALQGTVMPTADTSTSGEPRVVRQPVSVDTGPPPWRPPHQPRVDGPDYGGVTLDRLTASLNRTDVRVLTDASGSLLALWERHAILFVLEGPTDEILVMRVRLHSTLPPEWAERAYRVVNEWNHTRRFCKAYIGDPTDRGQLPIYAEMQVPLSAGVHDELLDELVDCATAVMAGFVDWLHDEGGLL